MNQRNTLLGGAAMGGTAVMIGAFGAHAFKASLMAAGRLETYELAVRYQFYHAFALLIVGMVMNLNPTRLMQYAAYAFLLGILFFSGSLYLLCLTGYRMLGAITPVGGVLFTVGWVLLFIGVYKATKKSHT
ncbi:MAG: DUF423 domain-containing protein [Cyclobacteriaceae bacterium]|jgi:uncharacterized membrane protein YgdD (TMEM256/DUF423 family)|nr:DUF423 domain-containing protein [Cyclobacteriaceae bacterium]MDH4296627.1 DUF423 domain-containing protein [Cyclobacteriaceae bacterium]MDH5247641.1 DUF423 domain-containing protein [Cyclobacteriaceae bacterium]